MYKMRTLERFYCKNSDLIEVLQDIKIYYGKYKTYLVRMGSNLPTTNKMQIVVIGYKRQGNEFKLIVNYYKRMI